MASETFRGSLIAAMAHHRAGRFREAEHGYKKILAADPHRPDALHMLGVLALQAGRNEAAVALISSAIAQNPNATAYYSNLGLAEKNLGRLDQAAAHFRQATRLTPEAPEPHNNLGIVFAAQGKWEEALACSARALELRPDFADAHANIGQVRRQQGDLAGAVACYRMAIRLRPDFAEAHTSLALALLQAGDFRQGWAEYEWRWKTPGMLGGRRNFSQPQWQGEPGNGRILLIHAEQGFGDSLQFCRFARLAVLRGWQVVLEVQQKLERLLNALPGMVVIGRGAALPAFDAQVPMLSLPYALGLGEQDIHADAYLRENAELRAVWQARLAASGARGRRVGLVWAGSHSVANAEIDRRRSILPALLAPLLQIPEWHFVSLQKDGPTLPPEWPVIELMQEVTDFADTAALIACLDLVISVDTAVAHLAGAMGKPVLLLNRFDSCWRWQHGQETSPWYKRMHIYRQPAPGDWGQVLAAVASDIGTDKYIS